jgi:hypothetical protein
MDFWFEFLDIHMNKKRITFHDYHGFMVEHKYFSSILTIFLCHPTSFLAHLIVTTPICIRMHKDYQAHTLRNPPLICGEFDTELKLLYGKIALEVINVLEPF